ncbi:helix-turn-helix domain-containing protein [Aurantimonas coralicida]|uniref:helix-turn-helix domain-containing protein n=1 Tax=Aurantimonas coralicida TaxID=182270 RepID=UPI001D18837A|nr:helix-turn-helix domain-containing protein [Aurantimonas coralicida]MCC4298277.1 helix-turn-helix domain-containing protein [Aurantimonas coralicida]
MTRDDNPDWSEAVVAPLDSALKLQAIRARLRLSQSAFAALLRIPRSMLQNWEQGRTAPDSFVRHVIDVIYDDPEGMRQRLERSSAA